MSHKDNKYILRNYQFIRTIGEGTFGKVKLSIHIPTNEYVAIKILEKSRIHDKEELERVEKEIKYLKALNHQNIVQIYEVIEDNLQYFYIVMEYVSGGELFNYIVANEKLDEKEASFFFCQLINGIKEIHRKKICHRDIKPENLLLTERKLIKIIDFGLSNEYVDFLSTQCGSPCYAAPEMIKGKKYNGLLIDLWACGIILFAMLCGYLPFDDKDNNILFRKILQCKVEFPDESETFLSKEAKDLILRILTPEPSKRIKLEEVLLHPFLEFGNKEYKNLMKPVNFNQDKIIIDYMVNILKYNNEDNLIYKYIKANKHNNYTTTYKLLKKKIIEGRFDYNYYIEKDIKYISPIKNLKVKINYRNSKNNKADLRRSIRENPQDKINKACSLDSTTKRPKNTVIKDLKLIKNMKYIEDNALSTMRNRNLMIMDQIKTKPLYQIISNKKNNNFKRKIDTSVSVENNQINRNQKNTSKNPKLFKNPFIYEKDSNNIFEYNNRKKIIYFPKELIKRNEISADKIKQKKYRYKYLPNSIIKHNILTLKKRDEKLEEIRKRYALSPISQIKDLTKITGLSADRISKNINKHTNNNYIRNNNVYLYPNNNRIKTKEHKEIISDLSTNISSVSPDTSLNYKRLNRNRNIETSRTPVNKQKKIDMIFNDKDEQYKSKINNNREYYNTIQGNRSKDKVKENRINNSIINQNYGNYHLYNVFKTEKDTRKDKIKFRNKINNNNEKYTPLKTRVKNDQLSQNGNQFNYSNYQQRNKNMTLSNDIFYHKKNKDNYIQKSKKDPCLTTKSNLNIYDIKYKFIGFCNRNNYKFNEYKEYKFLININNSDSFIFEVEIDLKNKKTNLTFFHNTGSEDITNKNILKFLNDINNL